MHLSVMPYQMAPVATGHPLSPPAATGPFRETMPPPEESGASGLGDRRGQPPRLPIDAEALLDNPEDVVAPPSLMQLRIMSLLDAAESDTMDAFTEVQAVLGDPEGKAPL